MDINRLNEFIVLATHLNYSKAANELFLTQPALSRHIHDLEQTVGAQLLIRDTHNVKLTTAGSIFLEEAKVIIERYEHALRLMKDVTSNTKGEVTVGFLSHAASPFLSKFIPYFNDIHPNIKLHLRCQDLDHLAKLINNDELDFAFVTHVDSTTFTGLSSSTVLNDRLYAIVSRDHPLASKDSCFIADMAQYKIIAYSKETHPLTYEFHKQQFKKAGVNYDGIHDVQSPEAGIFYAGIGEGVFMIPSHLLSLANGQVAIPVMDEHATINLNLLWKKSNPNPSMPIFFKEFVEFMKMESDVDNMYNTVDSASTFLLNTALNSMK